ncbi:MAG: M20/M25/M40 family metallo-hydrolase [Bacteroidales bacterium]|nr:M20/M25/M40 family metallo-hydrolase [Bacteroidales bacterium]
MKVKYLLLAIAILFLLPGNIFSQDEPVDLNMVYTIKQEGFKNSDIEELSFWMTDFVGPRLTASNGKKRGNEWASDRMEEYGLENVRIEAARPFDRGGWENQKTYIAMTSPYYTNFTANPKAWTGSTKGLIKGSPALLEINDESDFEQYKGKLKGKIVIMPSSSVYEVSFEPLAERYTEEDLDNIEQANYAGRRGRRGDFNFDDYRRRMMIQRQAADFLRDEGVAAILSAGGEFNVPRSSGASYTAGENQPVAELYLPVEAHGRIMRLMQHDVNVELELEVKNSFYNSPDVTNVIGEIPGTDPELKDEIVLLGGHWDSWHGGTGAADNASGCIVMMEAMRILKSLDISPRRTIRIALWGGEEQGLHGSRGYVEKYIRSTDGNVLEGFDNFAAYFNMDNGTGKFRGIYVQENDMVLPVFEAWFKPFEDMGCSTVTLRNTSGTDHLSFDVLGLPAFQFIQDEIEYGRGYHTIMDTYERLVMDDLKHNAVVVASLAYHAAMRDEALPRKPQLESLSSQQGRF